MQFREVKRNITKPDELYICELVWRDSWRAVLSYVTDRDYRIFDGFILPEGSLTLGFYWSGKGYIMWEMYGPARGLKGYYFHICNPPHIGDNSLEYLDLVLDIWFFPGGSFKFLDREELCEGIHERSRPNCVLLIQSGGKLRGFLVDAPRSIVHLPVENVFPMPILIKRFLIFSGLSLLRGIVRVSNKLMLLVDLSANS